jgi:multicomponent Na+:H+ antiporter subunit A
VTLWVCWELTTMCSFFLIGGQGEKGARPATRALLVTAGGGLALLGAVALMIVAAGTSDLTAILADPGRLGDTAYAPAVGVLLLIAAFTKSAQLPFSFWLPGAMVALTPVSAYLHAATMVKAGIYLLLRFSPVYADNPSWTYVLLTVGLATAVYGAVLALKQHDLKALLAYSTVSQLGFLVAATGVGTSEALGAVGQSDMRSILTFHMVSQTGYIAFGIALATPFAVAVTLYYLLQYVLVKTGLFLTAGAVVAGYGTDRLDRVGGLARREPVLAASFVAAAFSLVGFPPFAGFVAKLALVVAALREQQYVGAVAVVAVSLLTLTSMLKIWNGVFWGPGSKSPSRIRPAVIAPVAVPAGTSLVLGVAAQGILGLGEDAAEVLLEPLRYAQAVGGP